MKKLESIFLSVAILLTVNPVWAKSKQEEAKTAVPEVELTLLKAKRMGKGVVIPFRWLNDNAKDLKLYLDMNQGGGKDRVFFDNGESQWLMVSDNQPLLRSGVPLAGELWVPDVPADVEMLSAVFVVGRAPDSPKVTDSNSYGDFTYSFRNVPLKGFPSSGTPGVVFTNPDFNISGIKSRNVGNNLVIEYLITNNTAKDKEMRYNATAAVAYDADGNKYSVTTSVGQNFPSEVPVKVVTTVAGGAGEIFSLISLPFTDASMWHGDCTVEFKYFPR